MDALRRDRDQLWAEARVMYEAGSNWWLTHEEATVAEKEALKRKEVDPLEEAILEWWGNLTDAQRPRTIKTLDILRLAEENGIKTNAGKVGFVMKAIGFRSTRGRVAGVPTTQYTPTEALLSLPSKDRKHAKPYPVSDPSGVEVIK